MSGAEELFMVGIVIAILLICLVGFIVWIIAIIQTLKANVDDGEKIGWILFLILIPFIAVIVWLFVGPRARKEE